VIFVAAMTFMTDRQCERGRPLPRPTTPGNDLPESYDPVAGYEPALHASGY